MEDCSHHPQQQQTPTSSFPPIGTCCKCGGATTFAPPPPSPSFSEISPPPTYRPIRAPAIPPDPISTRAIMLAPVPRPHPVPPLQCYNFVTPTKRIRSSDDIRRFHDFDSGKHFLGFIVSLSESIRGRKISDPCHLSQTVTAIVSVLETLTLWVDEIPPTQQAARYGNVAYRTWHEKMVENAESLMMQVLHEDVKRATVEIVAYFTDSFGNASRIDYGTGHETNFAAWLYCLARLEEIVEQDYAAVVSRVLVKYLDLMRKLQLVYCLEPAGSHGVWGLDDYQFLPYIFGSSQLVDHKYMKPKSIHNNDILDNFSKDYLYLACIAFIRKVKKGAFAEHSPMLDDISGVPNWNKVNSGLLKMYKAEVLEKVPIMQHFLFGSIIEWHAREALSSKDGIFVMDLYGGSSSENKLRLKRRFPNFMYLWEQAEFDVIQCKTRISLHFHLKSNRENFAMHSHTVGSCGHTLPEIRDCLEEAEFWSFTFGFLQCRTAQILQERRDLVQETILNVKSQQVFSSKIIGMLT